MDEIILVTTSLSRGELWEIAAQKFGDLVKGVVDIEKRLMALGSELNSDEEAFLLERGSSQQDLWGINLYVDLSLPDMVEFDSMINIRPSQNNRSRGVDDPGIQARILEVISTLVQ